MKKFEKLFFVLGLGAMLTTACSGPASLESSEDSKVDSSTSEHTETSEESEEESFTSEETSAEESSTEESSSEEVSSEESSEEESSEEPEYTFFETPTNVNVTMDDVLVWDAVEGATNGYSVKLNNNAEQILTTLETSVDLLNSEFITLFATGLNTLQVMVNTVDYCLMSQYSKPVNFAYGKNKEAIKAFIDSVDAIGEVNEASLELINVAKEKYALLSEIDLYDYNAINAYDLLKTKDAQYFLLLVNAAKDDEARREEAKNYYEQVIDNTNSYVLDALKVPMSSFFKYSVINTDPLLNTIYVYAGSANILGHLIQGAAPKVKIEDRYFPMRKVGDGYMYDTRADIDIVVNEEVMYHHTYIKPLDGHIVGITEGANFAFNIVHDVPNSINNENLMISVSVYRASDVGPNLAFKSYPLYQYNTKNFGVNQRHILKNLSALGYEGKMDVIFLIEGYDKVTNARSLTTGEGISSIRHLEIPDIFKMASPAEMEMIPTIKENGDIDWRWELITKHPDKELLECMVIYFFDTSKELTVENALAVMRRTEGGFIKAVDIVNFLKSEGVKVDGSIEFKLGFGFIAKPNSGILDSDVTIANGSYNYLVDYRLTKTHNVFLEENTGRLNWMWEMFMPNINPEANEIECLRFYILLENETLEDINESTKYFDVSYEKGDRFTYKGDVVKALKANGYGTGTYRFGAKLIAKQGSEYQDSAFYPLTAAYTYEVE